MKDLDTKTEIAPLTLLGDQVIPIKDPLAHGPPVMESLGKRAMLAVMRRLWVCQGPKAVNKILGPSIRCPEK